MKELIYAFSFIFLYINIYSQEVWDLERCIQYAYEHNLQIRQQEVRTLYYKNQYTWSVIDILPSISGRISQNYNYGRAVDPFTNEFSTERVSSNNFSLTGSVTLFNGFQKVNNIKKSRAELMSSIEEVEKLKNDISLQIASAYLQILLSDELLNIANEQLKLTKEQMLRTKALVEAGSLTQGDLLELKAQVAREELNVVTARNQLELAYLTLKQLLDLDTLKDFRIQKPQIIELRYDIQNYSIHDLYTMAIRRLPRIRTREYKLESMERALAMARGSRYPNLILGTSFLTGYSDARQQITGIDSIETSIGTIPGYGELTMLVPDYTYGKYLFDEQVRDNANFAVYLQMSIPIFTNWQINTTISNAKLNVLSAKYDLELSKQQLFKDIQQAYTDAAGAYKKYQATQKTVNAMQTAFDYTKEKYNLGLVNTVDYNLAKTNLTRAKSETLQAKYEYIFKIKVLDFYKGVAIKL